MGRHVAAPAVPCAFCGAPAGAGCVNPLTRLVVGWTHLERVRDR